MTTNDKNLRKAVTDAQRESKKRRMSVRKQRRTVRIERHHLTETAQSAG